VKDLVEAEYPWQRVRPAAHVHQLCLTTRCGPLRYSGMAHPSTAPLTPQVVAKRFHLPCYSTRSAMATGSPQWGQGRPGPTRRPNRPQSGQRCSPRARVPQVGHS
jgi:hypothetical protein